MMPRAMGRVRRKKKAGAARNVTKKRMAADERRSTLMKTKCLSALIRVHRRPINVFSQLLSPASRVKDYRLIVPPSARAGGGPVRERATGGGLWLQSGGCVRAGRRIPDRSLPADARARSR